MLVQVVDDNETNLMLFERIAQLVADEVVTFLDPTRAIEACGERMPDLIVVDYMMPNMDGHEYVRRVRLMPGARDVPIIMVTAAAERRVRQVALELGVSDFIAKPIDPAEVKARLINLLALRRSHIRLRDQNRWLADEVRNATRVIAEREHELVVRLSKAAEFRDPETGHHIQRMAHYSRLIARNLGHGDEFCEVMLHAAPMHDVGKLGIPDGILLKPGRLDSREFDIMKRHAVIGYDILAGSESPLTRLGAEIALSHHEKFDGTGYPNHLVGAMIPLPGRIVAVADVFDALTSERPYKKAWPVEEAHKLLMECRGSHFDPSCVEAFLRSWEEILDVRARFADPVSTEHISDRMPWE